ncbi:urease accessory protein UreF [Bradyrhizobium sp. CCBAU 53380]|uniref:urease accessory protein UreF n=1 Tax=Bradyrhizobium sp. CCBAU 53380 TaxID=1325117 RepID=UPI002303936F|nr:urease accessory protein UreF [Bradyrhizobium sp. CCBAU 53380]MDA9424996.1 urease accessory protein UreF [Bradyrhizobium sp. CCBAU 53380]
MTDPDFGHTALAFLRLQSWLSPSFPNGAYSYSHGLEWAVEAGYVFDRKSLIEWLEADLCYGYGRNEAIFFSEAYRCVADDAEDRLRQLAELAAASRGTSEFLLESAQQSSACLATHRNVWPDRILDVFSNPNCPPVPAVLLGARAARERIAVDIALPAFLHSYVANLVSAGVRLVPLGQTDGQFAIAALERAILSRSEIAGRETVSDLGSAGVMVELASIAHELQYTRLFRS